MRPRYLGPLIVISCNKGGAYIICKLNRSVFDRPIAAFRVIPYFARRSLPLPNLDSFLDVPTDRIHELEESMTIDPEADETSASDILNEDSMAHSDSSSDSDNDD
jgi:hypothetical protein